MRLLKRTRESDRIHANLLVHEHLMEKNIVAGQSREGASQQAAVDLQNIPIQDRINQANELRRATNGISMRTGTNQM